LEVRDLQLERLLAGAPLFLELRVQARPFRLDQRAQQLGRHEPFKRDGINVRLFGNPDGELVGPGLRTRIELDYEPVVTVVHFISSHAHR